MVKYMIYWEKNNEERGFVSYDNPLGKIREQYKPVSILNGTRYEKKKDALKTHNWYVMRGGFGWFQIIEVQDM